jgi:hypothetical protein
MVLGFEGDYLRVLKESIEGFLKYKIRTGQKPHVFSHMWNTDLRQIQQCYEKQVMQRGGHIWVGGKKRKLRR